MEKQDGGLIWRIYRLPGSMRIWHIDTGEGTFIINVLGFSIRTKSESVDVGDGWPRAWIAVKDAELHVIENQALFTERPKLQVIDGGKDSESCAAVPAS